MQEIRIDRDDAGGRLDKYLIRLFSASGSGTVYKLLRKKRIKLNGARAKGNELLKDGDIIALYLADDTIEKLRGTVGETSAGMVSDGSRVQWGDSRGGVGAFADRVVQPLRKEEILYEDRDIMVIYKSVGELSQKAKPDDVSINERMLAYLRASGESGAGSGRAAGEQETGGEYGDSLRQPGVGVFTPSVCNRLDRNTAGIVLAGKTAVGLRLLSELIRERSIRKYYYTVVEGRAFDDAKSRAAKNEIKGLHAEDSCGILKVESFLIKDRKRNRVTVSDSYVEGSKKIETLYRVVDHRYDDSLGMDVTELEVDLLTGKSHQIRAQLAHLGYPLVGDVKYGSKVRCDGYELTAYKVVFSDDERLDPGIRGREVVLPDTLMR